MKRLARRIMAALLLAILFMAVLGGVSGVSLAAEGRPRGCPHAWCGCWLGIKLDKTDRALWRARNWANVGRRLDGARKCAVAVWHHHVGFVLDVDHARGRILMVSGNDGHRVRKRWRSSRGVIAWRDVGQCLN